MELVLITKLIAMTFLIICGGFCIWLTGNREYVIEKITHDNDKSQVGAIRVIAAVIGSGLLYLAGGFLGTIIG